MISWKNSVGLNMIIRFRCEKEERKKIIPSLVKEMNAIWNKRGNDCICPFWHPHITHVFTSNVENYAEKNILNLQYLKWTQLVFWVLRFRPNEFSINFLAQRNPECWETISTMALEQVITLNILYLFYIYTVGSIITWYQRETRRLELTKTQ